MSAEKKFSLLRQTHPGGRLAAFSLSNQRFAPEGARHQSVIFGFTRCTWVCRLADLALLLQVGVYEENLESYNPMNAIRPEDAELALVIAAKIDQATTAAARAGQRHLVDRTDALAVLVFEQHDRLTRHRCRQA